MALLKTLQYTLDLHRKCIDFLQTLMSSHTNESFTILFIIEFPTHFDLISRCSAQNSMETKDVTLDDSSVPRYLKKILIFNKTHFINQIEPSTF